MAHPNHQASGQERLGGSCDPIIKMILGKKLGCALISESIKVVLQTKLPSSLCGFSYFFLFPLQPLFWLVFLKGSDPMKITLILVIMAVTGNAHIPVWLGCQLERYAAAGVVYSWGSAGGK